MSIVSNTGPLIALAKVDHLPLLEQLFQQVAIPPLVQRELLAKTGPESLRLDRAFKLFLRVDPASSITPEVEAATLHLDAGEQAAIILAHTLGVPLMIDDRLGRQAAHQLRLPVTGTAGILIQAKQTGLISHVRPVLEEIRQHGYWLSDHLLDLAAHLAGETA